MAFAWQARAADDESPGTGFTEAQLNFVKGWIKESIPECPPQFIDDSAGRFLDGLSANHPEKFEALLSPDFPQAQFYSELLRNVAARLQGSTWEGLRQQLAERRIRAFIQAGNGPAGVRPDQAREILDQMRNRSDIEFHRLVEGRMEDDELSTAMMGREDRPRPLAAVQPPILTAADIVAAYSRHNQDSNAIQKLYSYVEEGSAESDEGKAQIILFKLRPDFVRLVVRRNGEIQSVIAGHGGTYWKQVPGAAPTQLPPEASTQLRYLGEFLDPLFADEGYTFERLSDGRDGTTVFYRVSIHRGDGSGYVVRIDSQTFQEIGREREDGTVEVNSDFRRVAGITISFRQETKSPRGGHSAVVLDRFTPNAGLTQGLFEQPGPQDQGYFVFSRLLADAASREKPKRP